jgi:hypothetical protein
MNLTQEEKDILTASLQAYVTYELDEDDTDESVRTAELVRISELQEKLGLGIIDV